MINKFNISKTNKITLSALFIAATIIFSKLLSIGNMPGINFLRISLGPTLLIFSSILLGPIYGGFIGFTSDFLGYFLFDNTGYAYNPLFSITYILYGILPAILCYFLKRNKKFKLPIIQILIILLINIFIFYFFLSNKTFVLYKKIYEITTFMKTLVLTLVSILSLLYFVSYYVIYKKRKHDQILLNNISIIVLISLLSIQVGVGILVKYYTYEVDPFVLFATQLVVTTIEIIISNYLILLLYKIFNKIYSLNDINTMNKNNKTKLKLKNIIKEELNKYINK